MSHGLAAVNRINKRQNRSFNKRHMMVVTEYTVKKGSKHQNRSCCYCGGRMTPGRKFVLDPEVFEGHLPAIFHPQCRVAWVKRGKRPLK